MHYVNERLKQEQCVCGFGLEDMTTILEIPFRGHTTANKQYLGLIIMNEYACKSHILHF